MQHERQFKWEIPVQFSCASLPIRCGKGCNEIITIGGKGTPPRGGCSSWLAEAIRTFKRLRFQKTSINIIASMKACFTIALVLTCTLRCFGTDSNSSEGQLFGNAMDQIMSKTEVLLDNTEATERIQRIADRLSPAVIASHPELSNVQFKVRIINSPRSMRHRPLAGLFIFIRAFLISPLARMK